MKLEIGTNDVEKCAMIVGKQSVKKIRNSKLIMYAMRLKVCDAEHDERCTRRMFMKKSVEYARQTYRGSPVDREFKRLMKYEVEKVWNIGKEKSKQKVANLMSKYAPEDDFEDIRGIVYTDAKLEAFVNNDDTNETDVTIYGGVTLSDKEKTALKMSPKYMTYPKIDTTETEVEIEKGCMKARYQLMNENENNNDNEREHDVSDTSTIDDPFKVLDFENKTADYANVKATDIPTCQRIFPPKPASLRRETIMQNIKDKMLNKVQEYKEKHCNDKGWVKTKNIRKEEDEGLVKVRERIKGKEIVVFESDKTGHFTADSVQNYEESLRLKLVLHRNI